LEHTAEWKKPARLMELQAAMQRRFAEWMLVVFAWACAIFTPIIFLSSPRDANSLKACL
jgi:hypothetical protein